MLILSKILLNSFQNYFIQGGSYYSHLRREKCFGTSKQISKKHYNKKEITSGHMLFSHNSKNLKIK